MDPHGNLRVCYGISPFWIGIYLFFIISIVCGFHSYVKVPKGSKGYEPIFYFTLSIFSCYPRYITIILPLNHHLIMIYIYIHVYILNIHMYISKYYIYIHIHIYIYVTTLLVSIWLWFLYQSSPNQLNTSSSPTLLPINFTKIRL